MHEKESRSCKKGCRQKRVRWRKEKARSCQKQRICGRGAKSCRREEGTRETRYAARSPVGRGRRRRYRRNRAPGHRVCHFRTAGVAALHPCEPRYPYLFEDKSTCSRVRTSFRLVRERIARRDNGRYHGGRHYHPHSRQICRGHEKGEGEELMETLSAGAKILQTPQHFTSQIKNNQLLLIILMNADLVDHISEGTPASGWFRRSKDLT
jgi:hypothetical protein